MLAKFPHPLPDLYTFQHCVTTDLFGEECISILSGARQRVVETA
ncbi:MAG: hypothetical protein P8169_02605 [Chloroflexota bacterium]